MIRLSKRALLACIPEVRHARLPTSCLLLNQGGGARLSSHGVFVNALELIYFRLQRLDLLEAVE